MATPFTPDLLEQARKQAPEKTACQRHHNAWQQRAPAEPIDSDDTKVTAVTVGRYPHQPGKHDRSYGQSVVAMPSIKFQLFNSNNHSTQRSVECGGNASCSSRHKKAVFADLRTLW